MSVVLLELGVHAAIAVRRAAEGHDESANDVVARISPRPEPSRQTPVAEAVGPMAGPRPAPPGGARFAEL